MKSRAKLKMGHVGSKTRSLGQLLENPCVCFRGHIFSSILMKLGRMFALMKSQMSLKLGHVWSKTRLLGPILEKPCVRCRGHIFSPTSMKFFQKVCLGEISDEFENGSCMI